MVGYGFWPHVKGFQFSPISLNPCAAFLEVNICPLICTLLTKMPLSIFFRGLHRWVSGGGTRAEAPRHRRVHHTLREAQERRRIGISLEEEQSAARAAAIGWRVAVAGKSAAGDIGESWYGGDSPDSEALWLLRVLLVLKSHTARAEYVLSLNDVVLLISVCSWIVFDEFLRLEFIDLKRVEIEARRDGDYFEMQVRRRYSDVSRL